MFGGDFSAPLHDHLRSAATKAPFPGNIIPADRIDPISKKLLNYYPSANVATRAFEQLPARRQLAHQQGPVHSPHGLSSSPPNRSGPAATAGATRTSPNQGITSRRHQDSHQLRSSTWAPTPERFSPNMVNEARFGYTRFYNSTGTFLAFTNGRRQRDRHSRIEAAANPCSGAFRTSP